MSDIRAADLDEGQTYCEFGDDEDVTITMLAQHGDRILVTGLIAGGETVERSYDRDEVVDLIVVTPTHTCIHCERPVLQVNGGWVDPEATGDDVIWRETCDANDTERAAPHEVKS